MAVLIVMAVACSDTETKDGNKEAVASESRVFPVKIQKLVKQKLERTLDYTADLIPFKEINYAPASPGRIDEINVEVGSRISKGDVLVELDKTQLNQAEVQYANARSNFNRSDTLYKLGSLSEQQYEQAKTQYDLAKSALEYQKDNTSLISPINGIVTGKYYENGELYSGAPNTAAGKAAIITIQQINPLKAMVSVAQSYFPVIKEGMKTTVTTDVYPDLGFTGKVHKVYPVINPATRTFQVEIVVENDSEKLRPGMFARISLKLKDDEALVVPAIAIIKEEGTNNRYIFIEEKGKARQIPVKPGKRFDEKVEVISDQIHEGMNLIIEGQANLLQGSEVKVIKD